MDNFGAYPIGKQRKQEVDGYKKGVEDFKVDGARRIKEGHYTWVNSELDSDDGSSFVHSFRSLLPPDAVSMGSYIEDVLKNKKGQAIGLEFGGIGSNLFSGFTENFFKKSVGVTLVDHRTKEAKARGIVYEKSIRHEVLQGDILSDETYEKLGQILAGQKVDLIIERMARGLEFIPPDPYTVNKIIQRWYSLLDDGGIMFIQVPVALNPLLMTWIKSMSKAERHTLGIEEKLGKYDTNASCSSVKIIKKPGSPKELPVLNPKKIRAIDRFNYKHII